MSTSLDTPILDDAPRQGRDNFRSVLNVLADRWLLLLAGTLLGALAFGGGMWLTREVTPARYQATGSLYIKPAQYSILSPQSPRSDFTLRAEQIVKETSVAALAEKVAQALIQRDIATGGPLSGVVAPEEFKREAARIEARLALSPLTEDGVGKVEIHVRDCASPGEAEDIAEYASRVFVEMNRQVHLEDVREKHAFIRRHIESLRTALAGAEADRLAFKQRHSGRPYENIDEELARKDRELREIEAAGEAAARKLSDLEAELVLAGEQFPEALNQPSDNLVAGLFAELDALLEEKMTLSAIYQPAWPRLVELEEEIAEVREVILEAERRRDSGVPGGSDIWAKRKEIYQQQIDLRLQMASLEIQAGAIERERETLLPQLPELANLKWTADSLKREVDNIEEQLNKASDRELEVRASIEHGLGTVERSASAPIVGVPERQPGSRNVWINFLIGGLAGALLSFALAMAVEFNDTSIRSIDDVNEYIGLEVIGTIPRMRFGRPRGNRRRRATYVSTVDEEQIDSCIVTQHDPKSPISEAYRTLRTNFQFATIQKKPRTLMVTSAVPGEGKTTTAVNLAVTMADRGMRVLLVDTDLRRPNVHRVLRMERGPGLADVLREGVDPDTVIRKTRIDNLWVVSSGRVPPNPSELMGSDAMEHLMRKLGAAFDLVICDAPSVLVVTDPVLLATHVDTCMMVVSTNNARRETVVRAKKLLLTAKVDVAGVVVNGLETTRRHYYYYYYYYDDGSAGRRKWYHF
ncbi:MAG: polysaccharide biosynthesis tyrosine autokinase [Candidatus Hydrogenedentes bacterium]|nr:polysaccharide biosynthesis tyrosine autokinase [Candidatus Hydrogenedentota bacterium]